MCAQNRWKLKNANRARDKVKKKREVFMENKDIYRHLAKKAIFNADGDTDVLKRRMIGGNTTNLNDFNNIKYAWTSDWYRQAMNNFWIPEEINLQNDVQEYRRLTNDERSA